VVGYGLMIQFICLDLEKERNLATLQPAVVAIGNRVHSKSFQPSLIFICKAGVFNQTLEVCYESMIQHMCLDHQYEREQKP
jgi:hypothetical protein